MPDKGTSPLSHKPSAELQGTFSPRRKPFIALVSSPRRVALRNNRLNITLVFTIVDSVSLGREPTVGSKMAHVNLEPYDAYQLGISRIHAVLKLESGNIYIIDNASLNGVMVNQQLITPGVAYLLSDRDTIRLGGMSLQITFPTYRFDVGIYPNETAKHLVAE